MIDKPTEKIYFPPGKNEKCPHCGKYNNRSVTVDAVIVQNERLLLIRRGVQPFKGFWALPGGHVDWNETVEQAVIREIREEVKVVIEKLTLLGVYSSPERHPEQSVAISYVALIKGFPSAGSDAEAVRFFPLDKLPDQLAFDHHLIISDYRAKFGK